MTTPSRTDVAAATWGPTPQSHRRYEGTSRIGTGEDTWQRASEAVLHDDVVSLTRPSTTPGWALVHPVLRFAQVVVRRRYLRALR